MTEYSRVEFCLFCYFCRKCLTTISGEIIDWESFDDHMVAGLLKQWIRELPEPLMTWGLYDEWIKARGNQGLPII